MNALEVTGAIVGIIAGASVVTVPLGRMFAKSIAEEVMSKHIESDNPHAGKHVHCAVHDAVQIAKSQDLRRIFETLTEIKVQIEHLNTLMSGNGKDAKAH